MSDDTSTTTVSAGQLRAIVERIETVADLVASMDAVETWRHVEEWPGYEVSSHGRVRGPRAILSPVLSHGYLKVTLSRGPVQRGARVHRLVAKSFLGPPPFSGALVAHNDGDPTNNRVTNLRWASALENQGDRRRHSTRVHGSSVYGAKLRERDIPAIRARIKSGDRYPGIAKDFGVSVSTIYLIGKNRTWRDVA